MDTELRLAPSDLPTVARELLGVTPDCVRMWRHRGHLKPGADGLYRLGDVLKCNGRMQRKPQSHRTLVVAGADAALSR